MPFLDGFFAIHDFKDPISTRYVRVLDVPERSGGAILLGAPGQLWPGAILGVKSCPFTHVTGRVFLGRFPSENRQANPQHPKDIFGNANIPPEPEKIARYLMLSAQKRQKRGSKFFYPQNPFSGRFTRGIRKHFLNPKFLEKLIFIACLGLFFQKIVKFF